jgi:cephalosporin-C deacetylase-like acetyl esterase
LPRTARPVVVEGGGETNDARLATALDRPGFVRIEAELLDADSAVVARFDGGAGADVDTLRADAPEPPDLDAFWTGRKAALDAMPMDGATCVEIASPCAGVRIFEIAVPCPGGRPCTALLSVPAAGGPFPAFVRFRGYEMSWSALARNTPPPAELQDDALVLFVSAHGFAFNREPAYYAALREASRSNGYDVAFDPAQNSNPATAYFGGMSWRVLRALQWLKRRPEWDGRSLTVFGGSMAGLQSIWAAAFDPDVTECQPRIPWCCNMAGPAMGRAHGDWFVPWVPALGYYDPVHLARRIPATCHVVIPQAGLGDYVCPPSGVMAFYNSLTCPKEATFLQGATHFFTPPEPWQTAYRTSNKN